MIIGYGSLHTSKSGDAMKRLMLALLGAAAVSGTVFAEPPQYTAMKTGSEMVMDGVLNEPAWEKAQPVGAFVFQWYQSGDKEQTEAKILWDDERIYFAFKCDDAHISADVFSNNGPVSRDDCCEAFISPVPEGPERTDYINYEINCLGTHLVGYHARSRNENRGRWDGVYGLEIGRDIVGTCNNDEDVDNGWVLEFSVPYRHFEGFGATFPPKDGQVVYIGLHRCGGKTNPQYSQWAPSQTPKPSYHQPQDFGKVTFSTNELK